MVEVMKLSTWLAILDAHVVLLNGSSYLATAEATAEASLESMHGYATVTKVR